MAFNKTIQQNALPSEDQKLAEYPSLSPVARHLSLLETKQTNLWHFKAPNLFFTANIFAALTLICKHTLNFYDSLPATRSGFIFNFCSVKMMLHKEVSIARSK